LFYVFCGIAATLSHAYSNPESVIPSIGASGAIAGVLGAYLAMFPKARVMTLVPLGYFLQVAELPALIVLGLWFVLQIFSGFASLSAQTAQSAGVAWWAHIGGFVVGLIVGGLVHMRGPQRRRPFSALDRGAKRRFLRSTIWFAAAMTLPSLGWSEAKVLIPNQQHDKLTFELHTIADKVTFYIGDPQEFLALTAKPGSIPPRVDFTNTARVAVLRILDQTLFEDTHAPGSEFIDGEWEEENAAQPQPEKQNIELKLSPASPATFVLRVEQGEGVFDFTDLQVEDVYLLGDSTHIEVEFARPNLILCERFKLTMIGGEMEFLGLLNAKAKRVTLQIPRTEARVAITGKPFAGTSEIFFEGTPQSLSILVSKKVGLQVSGLSVNVVQFNRKGMKRVGSSLVSEDYDDRECKVHLHFARPVPNLEVDWD
jgi:hypothetical protein